MDNHILKYNAPAKVWEEALPLGNGELGAMVYGGVDVELIRLNCDTFWKGDFNQKEITANPSHLKHLRQLVYDKQYDKAMDYASEVYGGGAVNAYIPVGDLVIKRCESGYVKNYERCLNLRNGEITVDCTEEEVIQGDGPILPVDGFGFVRNYFISAKYGVLVCDLRQTGEKLLSYSFGFDGDLPAEVYVKDSFLHMKTIAPENIAKQFLSERSNQTVSADCAMCVEVYGNQADVQYFNDKIIVYNAERILLYCTCITDYSKNEQKPDKTICLKDATENRLQIAQNTGFDEIYQTHIRDFNSFYDRCVLDLGDANVAYTDIRLHNFREGQQDLGLVELMFNFGRYLMISGSRAGSQPLNLQGIWNHRVNPPWNSDYTLNINAQMNYWLAECCNLSEFHEPLLRMVDELRPNGRVTAKAMYGCNGFCVHHNTDLHRQTTPAGKWANCALWPMGGVWLCQHIWEHYEYTLDDVFLREKAYPILRECAEFVLDFMIEDDNGYLITNPSISPENGFIFNDTICGVAAMTTMDRTMIEELLRNFIKACKILCINDTLSEQANQAIEHLFPFHIDSEGRLMEWQEEVCEWERGHRHLSHLYGVFPGNMITSDTPELFNAAKRSLDIRLENGSGYTGWSAAWIMNLYAAFYQGNDCWNMMTAMIENSVYPNLFDAHPPFQIDGNFGFSAAVANMLLRSRLEEKQAILELLPAKPVSWKKGSIKGLKAKGNISVDIEWNEYNVIASIHSLNGSKVKTEIPEYYKLTIVDCIENQSGKRL